MSTILCANCHKDIQNDKYDLHEAFCARYNKYCDMCRDVYDLREDPQHTTQHEWVICRRCQFTFQRKDNHNQQACRANSIECEFCQNNYPLYDLERHIEQCGSRTEECQSCHNKVRIARMAAHLSRCIGPAEVIKITEQPEELYEISKDESGVFRKKQNKKTADNTPATIGDEITEIKSLIRHTNRTNIEKKLRPSRDSDSEDVYQMPKTKPIKKAVETRPKRPPVSRKPAHIDNNDQDVELQMALALSIQHH